MEFFHVPFHIALKRKFTVTVLNWTIEEFSLVLKKMASQVVLSSVAEMAIINWTSIRPLQQNQKDQIKVRATRTAKTYLNIHDKKPSNLYLEIWRERGPLEGASQEVSHLIIVHSSLKIQPLAFWSSLYEIQC
jgi:hypothetical protein